MEKRLKNITIAILAIAASGAASAAMYTPAPAPACTPGAVTTPCESSAWGLGIEGLYVQPTTGINTGAFHRFRNGTVVGNFGRVEEFNTDPKWAWGFRLDGTYQFGQGSDLSLNWTHFQKSNDDNHIGGGLFSPFLPFTTAFERVRFDRDVKFDAVNLEFGQRLIVGDRARVRYHAGLQYVNIRDNFGAFGRFTDFETVPRTFAHGIDIERKFQGIGPRIGADMSYDLGNGFALVGKAAGAILVGTSKLNVDTFTRQFNQANVFRGNFDAASSRAIVPGVEAQLGAKYTYAAPAGDFSIEAGWKVASYTNALATPTGFGLTTNTNPIVVNPFPTGTRKDSFSYQGPYLGLKWLGNA